ncbi:hypothetical protein BCR39DRAFT_524105 [Naematelia encephala]|uniref:RFX-type winged-helix domain-containing protein n=1 Tax=Naematelia encephala TaxID=71784 RepID=A0A1Y2BDF0_9TREE|nr:hypothetical protein BCR39DRAFT_524105 [Naematelia encephala]
MPAMATPAHTGRPMAPLPHTLSSQNGTAPRKAPSPYAPDPRELQPGPRNRFFLSLRSGIESEVDWALPRLVVAAFDHPEQFSLDSWPDALGALIEWPRKWLEDLEREAALLEARKGQKGAAKEALAIIPEWTRDPNVTARATNSLLVLRNASFSGTNIKLICRSAFLNFVSRFFALPLELILEVLLRDPEPVQHLLVVLQSIFPHVAPTPRLTTIFGTILPTIAVETRDFGILNLLLPLIISGYIWPSLPPPPDDLAPFLLTLLTLTPPAPLLDLTLDLLISLTQQPTYARMILSYPNVAAYLRNIVMLLEYGARQTQASWEAPPAFTGVTVPNPAGGAAQAEAASRRRALERDSAQRQLRLTGTLASNPETADHAPNISPSIRAKLYAMKEPARSINWMHETFTYSASSQLLQVTFWHAYRNFFSHPSTVEQLLSASEVIKNVTIAFPGASAKIWTDETGTNKFVIAGMGFRKGSDESDRFNCMWRGCSLPRGCLNPVELLQHVQTFHLSPTPASCAWATCQHSTFNLTHLLTHLPLSQPPTIPDDVTIEASFPPQRLLQPVITTRPVPPLSRAFKLSFQGYVTPSDNRRNPTGCAFLAALVLRNLAKTLKAEIAVSLPPDHGLTQEAKQEKKRHLLEERFGLPIPDSVLKEEEEEERVADGGQGDVDGGMTAKNRERARQAFAALEERILQVVEKNVSGLAVYLGEAFGW